jgi:hypothetical protein
MLQTHVLKGVAIVARASSEATFDATEGEGGPDPEKAYGDIASVVAICHLIATTQRGR